jgi:hypothetical protein
VQKAASACAKTFYFITSRNSISNNMFRPIVTYRNQGTQEKGVNPEEHTLVYAAKSSDAKPPKLLKGEKLNKDPIRMKPDRGVRLPEASRINFGKVYTVEHHAKVVSLGKIIREHLPKLKSYYDEVRTNHQRVFNSDEDEDDDSSEEEDEDDEYEYRSSPRLNPYDDQEEKEKEAENNVGEGTIKLGNLEQETSIGGKNTPKVGNEEDDRDISGKALEAENEERSEDEEVKKRIPRKQDSLSNHTISKHAKELDSNLEKLKGSPQSYTSSFQVAIRTRSVQSKENYGNENEGEEEEEEEVLSLEESHSSHSAENDVEGAEEIDLASIWKLLKQRVVERLIRDHKSLLIESIGFTTYGGGREANTTRTAPATINTAESSEPSSQPRGQKRPLKDNDSGPSDEEQGDGKRNAFNFGPGVSSERKYTRFACHFYKRDPEKYRNEQACTGPGFVNIERLKLVSLFYYLKCNSDMTSI